MTNGIIVFDLDGTLIDSARDLVPALNRTTARDGLPPVPMNEVGTVVGQGALAMIARAFAYHDRSLDPVRHKELLAIFLEEYEARIASETVWYDGVFEALDTLESEGWRFAICTNKYERLARLILAQMDGGDRFGVVTGGDTFAFRKPDPRHITETAAMVGDGPVIMVGDSVNDIEAARLAGIPSIGVTFGYTDVPMADLQPTVAIDRFTELPGAVEKVMVGDTGIEPVTPAV